MHVPTRPGRQPGFDLGVLMRGVVIDDHMDVQPGGHGRIGAAQEGEELLMPMAGFAFGAIEHIERGKQGRHAMAHVIVGNPFDVAEAHRQQRRGAL